VRGPNVSGLPVLGWQAVLGRGERLVAEFDRTVDGAAIVIRSTFTPIRDPSGACRWSEDISADLALLRDLAHARDEAQAANQAKPRFLASATHELRTPLNAVIGFADLLARGLPDRQHQRHAQAIAASGRSLLALVNDLLDLARIEAGRLELHFAPASLRALLRGIEASFGPAAADKGVRLVVRVDARVPAAVVVDAERVCQIAVNLVGNAVKFTQRGQISLDLAAEPAGDRAVDLVFAASDTGIGIADADLARVFGEFEQVGAAQTGRAGGTGLGLAISRRLAERMGGSLAVASTPGAGSRFTLTLPGIQVAAEAAVDHATPPGHAGVPLASAAACVIVADPTRRALIAALFTEAGLRVCAVATPAECLTQDCHKVAALVLVDGDAVCADGGEQLRAIIASAEGASPAVISVGGVPEQFGFTAAGLCHGAVSAAPTSAEIGAAFARFLAPVALRPPRRRHPSLAVTEQVVSSSAEARAAIKARFAAVRDDWQLALRARALDGVAELAARFVRWGDEVPHAEFAEWARRARSAAEGLDLDELDHCAAEIAEIADGTLPEPAEVQRG